MRKYINIKKAVAISAVAVMSLGLLAGCKDKKDSNQTSYSADEAKTTKVMVVGDYDINYDEMMVYVMQMLISQQTSLDSWNDETEETYKTYILSEIRESKIMYDVTQHNDVTLDDKDMETVNNSVANFKTLIPEEARKQYGVSDEIIEKVFKEQACNAKFENDIKNSMGNDIETDLKETYKDTIFHSYYYLVFPTVQINASDEPATDADGNYLYVSDSEKADMKKKAEEAVAKLKGGANCEEIAKEYGIDKYSKERSGYQGAYKGELNDFMSSAKSGECTEPIEDTLGYVVYVMLEPNDEALRDSYIYASTQDILSDQFDKLKNQWLSTIEIDMEKDMEGTVWEDVSVKGVLEAIVNAD